MTDFHSSRKPQMKKLYSLLSIYFLAWNYPFSRIEKKKNTLNKVSIFATAIEKYSLSSICTFHNYQQKLQVRVDESNIILMFLAIFQFLASSSPARNMNNDIRLFC